MHDIHEGGEEQEARQPRAADGVALGRRLGHVAHRVEPVSDVAHLVRVRVRVRVRDRAGARIRARVRVRVRVRSPN